MGRLYQQTVRGRGFDGPGQKWPAEAVKLGRQKAKELDLEGPFHFMGHPHQEMKRDEAFDAALEKLRKATPGQDPIVLLPHEYDQPGISFRAIKDAPDVAPWIALAYEFEAPCTSYLLGSQPEKPCPTRGDCSGLVRKCIGETKGIWLPHSSTAMWSDPRIDRFFNPDATVSGDIVFYSFGRLGGSVDDVTMVVGESKPGMQIGSRPSIKPGYHQNGVQVWSMAAPGERENRVGFGRLRAA